VNHPTEWRGTFAQAAHAPVIQQIRPIRNWENRRWPFALGCHLAPRRGMIHAAHQQRQRQQPR
jgi:hypothetical protein